MVYSPVSLECGPPLHGHGRERDLHLVRRQESQRRFVAVAHDPEEEVRALRVHREVADLVEHAKPPLREARHVESNLRPIHPSHRRIQIGHSRRGSGYVDESK